MPTRTLNDGNTIPTIGLGTYDLRGDIGAESIAHAIAAGYRLLDTAVNYDNEGAVGEGIRKSGIDRSELCITSKLPGRYHDYDRALAIGYESAWRLGIEQIDLYLIHWPNPKQGKFVEAWRALIELQKRGVVRSIGVSNFLPQHLQQLIDETGVTPAVNQVELHPYFPQVEQRAFHAEHGIQTESWSPLGKRNPPYEEAPVKEAAERHGVSPAQVVLRWHVQIGSLPIPKSSHAERQAQNLDVFGFELSDAEVAAITALGRPDGRWFGGDPSTHEEF